MEFPTFSRTIGPGDIAGKASVAAVDEPIVIGGRTIHSGDVIVGDNDGVVVIRPEELDDLPARAQAIKDWEEQIHRIVAEGKSVEAAYQLAGPMP